MPRNKKELTLREKNIKELLSCRKKIEKLKQNFLQDLSTEESNIKFVEETMNDLIEAFTGLHSIAEHFIYKDDERELDE